MENLDLACAELGKKLAEVASEKLLTDALAVLEEQGVYAFFLFLKARGKSDGAKVIDECKQFLTAHPQASPLANGSHHDSFAAVQDLAKDLDNLLLARDLLRQAFVYGRYHAKARDRGAEARS
jgi:hypothetical protein